MPTPWAGGLGPIRPSPPLWGLKTKDSLCGSVSLSVKRANTLEDGQRVVPPPERDVGDLVCIAWSPNLPPLLYQRGVIRVKELPLPLQPTFLPGHLSPGARTGLGGVVCLQPCRRCQARELADAGAPSVPGAGLAAGKDLWGEGHQDANGPTERLMPLECAPRVSRGWPSREKWEGSVVRTSPGMGVETCTSNLPLHQPGLASCKSASRLG